MVGLSSESPGAAGGLSVVIIALDEEARLAQCLASVSFADEVVVLDSGSRDRTVEIARAAGARVETSPDWPGFGPQKNRALALATRDWVLSIDADERVTPGLREEILAVVRSGAASPDAFDMPRRSSYCGQYMAHSGWYPDRVTRLFRRGRARFSDDIVHERLVTQGPVGHLRSDLLHETFDDLGDVLRKLDAYSTAGARRMWEQGRRASLARAVASGLWSFIRTYLLQRGFLDGRMGFVLAVSNAEGTYYRYLKLWLLERAAASGGR
jgi:glycosyltransferase involved in cell wall biosynthesis